MWASTDLGWGFSATAPARAPARVTSYRRRRGRSSLAAADEPFPTKLYESLKKAKGSCWKFDESAVLGRGVWANIDRAIRAYDKIIVVCSERSLQRPAVLEEIEKGLDKEDELKKQGANDTDVLFPVRLDDSVLDGWQHERKGRLLKKVIGDFRGCAPGSAKYRREFGRLMRALDPRSWPIPG